MKNRPRGARFSFCNYHNCNKLGMGIIFIEII